MATLAHQRDLAQARLQARYRLPLDTSVVWNEVLDTLLDHRSVRHYLPDALPEGTLEVLVAAAQSAATSSNLQPWSVIAIEDPVRKSQLADYAGDQQHVRDCPLYLLWLVDLQRLEGIGEAEGTPARAIEYLETFVLGCIDTSLAAQNAVVALESLGLGTVYTGGIRNRPAEVAELVGLPPHVFALFGMCVGYPDPAAPAAVKPRLPQEAILFRETYGEAQPGALDRYNAILREFQAEQGLPSRDWTEIVSQRLKGPESLHGRDKLWSILNDLGFPLR